MRYRQFGTTDMLVSEVGFGAWAIGGAANVGGVEIGWGPTDDRLSEQALLVALDAGINFFDTADFYGLGHSERLIGKVLSKQKDALVATKVGQKIGHHGNIEVDYSKEHILKACEESLVRLQRETIDFYQLHVARIPHLQDGACIEAMEQLVQQGKVRYWGISLNTFNPDPEAAWFFDKGYGHGFQLVLNLINQRAIPILKEAHRRGLGVIARMPLQFGLLSGALLPDHVFDAGDHRARRLTSALIQTVLEVLEREVKPMAASYHTTLAGLALSFILGFPEVSTVIPGIRKPDQVERNTATIVTLSKSDMEYLRSLFQNVWQPVLEEMEKIG